MACVGGQAYALAYSMGCVFACVQIYALTSTLKSVCGCVDAYICTYIRAGIHVFVHTCAIACMPSVLALVVQL